MSESQIKVEYVDHMGSDLSVVNAARVSFGKKHEEFDEVKDAKLIKYLASHKHISPFGHCFASFHVKAPVFVARQLVKHKFLRWNEISRRYVDDEPEFYVPDEWRGRSPDKKQGSEGEVAYDYDKYLLHADQRPGYGIDRVCLEEYKDMLAAGICPEQARMVLPQSMMTEWYWSGSLDAFSDMCNLRCKPDTQLESQLVANQIDEKMSELFPISWKNLRKN
ncbi:MAG: FAD-dependent thymidylate synthase [Candidatus Thiodiazotropha taylori]|uniref:FAD-dependent thymidylate synthase n=1 Tax=Candidatus Thiodiazotropha taylori TaxID=2792791 RepID=A0A9E4K8J0_9GAMM|nr:FAD-dependent thymidylate synthase [Candidatus Thiodiazotropha taylori]MCW4254972.1 FAD-dependent thymidylate synthase [Candidatus Thiodiazotropha taylori]